jgi:hypothetical protein
MQLRTYLRAKIVNCRKASRVLEKTDLNNSHFVVQLHSLWADQGEQSPRIEYEGRLEDAIKKAEETFKSTNHRSDIQAKYQVDIKLADVTINLPEQYWESYKEQRR